MTFYGPALEWAILFDSCCPWPPPFYIKKNKPVIRGKADRRMARSTGYFKQLFTMDPPRGELQTAGLQTLDADLPIDETAPSVDDIAAGAIMQPSAEAPDT